MHSLVSVFASRLSFSWMMHVLRVRYHKRCPHIDELFKWKHLSRWIRTFARTIGVRAWISKRCLPLHLIIYFFFLLFLLFFFFFLSSTFSLSLFLFLSFFFCRTVWTVESGRYYASGKYRSMYGFQTEAWRDPDLSARLDPMPNLLLREI